MKQNCDLLLIKTHLVKVRWVPLGLLYVAAAAEKAGAGVKVLDLSLETEYKKTLMQVLGDYQPRIVGIGGMYEEFEGAQEIAGLVRRSLPSALMVAGGPFALSLTSELLLAKHFDIAVIKEGESAIQDILRYVDGQMELKEIPGIAYISSQEVRFTEPRPPEDINAMIIPAWHLLDVPRYVESKDNYFGIPNLRVLDMSLSRGCPYSCVFCDKNVFGQKWRGRNPKNIVDEMLLLRDSYGANAVMFWDDILDVNKQWVFDICDEIMARRVNMYWGGNSRANHADYSLYKKMHDAGCRFLGFGFEFGSDAVLAQANKKAEVAQADRAIEIAKAAGLYTLGYFMMGMLDETEAQILETMRFALASKVDTVGVSIVTPIAGTRLYEMAVEQGKINRDDPWWRATRDNAFINLTRDVSNARLAYLRAKTYWMSFWTRPSRRYPRWFCAMMRYIFYCVYPFTRHRFVDFVNLLDALRRRLRLGLP